MNNSTKLTLLSKFIFVIGVLGYVSYIHRILNTYHHTNTSHYPKEALFSYPFTGDFVIFSSNYKL
ncbi:hypothetical protein GCM10007103_20190 [Salinimicrobium marinum]|uniref:Uncharacterized protein n=1 Tax=Salinimicrobium marinum TaxID=680283 RepID=A0A918SF29_9FLAO|nr:hypothetical protein [Salinimicrobium marinum]GHA38765.1 hypothetical protein GCM10007103_20190 [Salinimicrobium marinum]